MPQWRSWGSESGASDADGRRRVWTTATTGVLLREMVHALGSEPDVEGVVRASSHWIGAALGLGARRSCDSRCPTRVVDLRTVLSDGEGLIDDDSLERASAVFDGKVTSRLPARAGTRAQAVTIPIVSRGFAYGVLDIVAPAHVIDERWDTLVAVVGQVAVALSNATARDSLDRGPRDDAEGSGPGGAGGAGPHARGGAPRDRPRTPS